MLNQELTRVLDAIKADPHGEVARNVCHWLAVNVMGWKLIIDPLGQSVYEYYIDTPEYVKRHENVGNKQIYSIENKIKAWMPVYYWQPLTDAHHTRMLVLKCNPTIGEWGQMVFYSDRSCKWADSYALLLNPYGDDPTHDSCQVLRKCRAEGTLTDETLKGFNMTTKLQPPAGTIIETREEAVEEALRLAEKENRLAVVCTDIIKPVTRAEIVELEKAGE